MREIKFRAWNPKHQKRYDDPYDDEFLCEGTPVNHIFSKPLDGQIYLQYTGLKDKNGKEIYEGDVVHITNPCGQCQSQNSPYGRNPWGEGCAYAWDKNWEARIGLYRKREEFTTLSHNGKHTVVGSHFVRTDVTAEHFVVDSPWITENYGEVIGNIYDNPELLERP